MNSKHQSYKPQEFPMSLATLTDSIQGLTHECLKLAKHNSFLEEKVSELEPFKDKTQYLEESLKVALAVAFGNSSETEQDPFQMLMEHMKQKVVDFSVEEIEVEEESTATPDSASPTSPASSSWHGSWNQRSRNQK